MFFDIMMAFLESLFIIRDVEAAIASTTSTPITSASNRAGLYLIYELADKHDYQNQQLTIYKGTLLVETIA